MCRIVLVRPGQTDYDEQERIKGRLSIPLNRAGAIEVAEIVRALKPLEFDIDQIYTAPCRAAEQTAEAIGEEYGIRCTVLRPLQNLDRGLWEGKLIREIRQQQPKVYRRWQDRPETVRPPEGEMLEEGAQRVLEALAKPCRRYQAGTIVVVIPEPLATIVGHTIDQRPLGDLWEVECSSGGWELVDGKLEHVAVR